MSVSGNRKVKQSQVRIIGGQWRGRKITFTAVDGLRPTGDRVRETLFNWLDAYLYDARCADLFAGSGALGLEALSRGASYCDFVDSSSAVLAQVTDHLTNFDALDKGCCHCVSAQDFLRTAVVPYDIIFIDPPFKLQMAEHVCNVLAHRQLLCDGALVYVETGVNEPPYNVSPGWTLHREKVSGGVAYRLFVVSRTEDAH